MRRMLILIRFDFGCLVAFRLRFGCRLLPLALSIFFITSATKGTKVDRKSNPVCICEKFCCFGVLVAGREIKCVRIM